MTEFKAIETHYNGYRFRSRLEARWAVFFDTLSLDYLYEPEGYSLEGTLYLPDFFLPKLDCFLEVKGQEPTQEELEKARLLALYTGKQVYILWGSIGLALEAGSHTIFLYHSPEIWTHPQGQFLGEYPTIKVEAPQMVKVLLQRLEDYNIDALVRHRGLELRPHPSLRKGHVGEDLQEYLDALEGHHENLLRLMPLLTLYGDGLITALTPEYGWEIEVLTQDISSGLDWAECSACGNVTILLRMMKEEDRPHHQCPHQGIYTYDSPRLLAAYTAARSARFEHGEKGGRR